MPSKARRAPEPAPEPAPPPFWVADRPLPVADEMGGETVPARAFNPGDRVPHEHVERYGWADYVHDPFAPEPEDGEAPADESAGEPPPEPAPDDPAAAQATTDEAGEPGTEEL
jgi:hypothetical protein